jgi:hypothetical protein
VKNDLLPFNPLQKVQKLDTEGRERRETTPVDNAVAQRRLREDYGWTDTKIAEFYRCSAPYVGTLKKLLTLPTRVQRLVHGKELSVQAATALADLPPDEQANVLATLLPEQPVSALTPAQDQPVSKQRSDGPTGGDQAVVAPTDKQPPAVPQADAKAEALSQGVNRKVREAKVAKGGK